jgi:ribosomal protein S27AE
MANWKLKCCPRCGGDVFLDAEENDWFAHCLQCGFAGIKKPVDASELSLPVGRPMRTARRLNDLKHARAR